MRLTIWILLLFSFVAAGFGAVFLSCEETLQVCPACGDVMDGDAEIIGDPRIDKTFASVQKLRDRVAAMSRRADVSLQRLMNVFEVHPAAGETDMEALRRTVSEFMASFDAPIFGVSIRFGNCAVDRSRADHLQNICEDRLCNIDRPATAGLCRGLSKGPCPTASDGRCFQPSTGPCGGVCVGTCSDTSAVGCPGDCFGSCEGTCLTYAEDGSCAGICDGNCIGYCSSSLPFGCAGTCTGACGDDPPDAGCNDTDTFVGFCESASVGECRGQYYPEGCGTDCAGCIEIGRDCREISKFSAWTEMRCSASTVEITPSAASDRAERASVIQKASELQTVLQNIADDYTWLSLVLDGVDASTSTDLSAYFKNGEDGALDEIADQYYDFSSLDDAELPPVDLNRKYLPVEALKARIYWLRRVAMNSSGGFRVTAGNFDCLEPALDDAASLLLAMVPVVRNPSDGAEEYIADIHCARTATDGTNPVPVPCLYNLISSQSELLELPRITVSNE